MASGEAIAGGCLCGAVRYESTAPPQMFGACHCRMCQRWSGAGAVMTAVFDRATFRFTEGAPRIFMASPLLERHFCGDCGTSILHRYVVPPYGPDAMRVGLGTLDEPTVGAGGPQFHFAIESRLEGWLEMRDGVLQIDADEDDGLASAWAVVRSGEP